MHLKLNSKKRVASCPKIWDNLKCHQKMVNFIKPMSTQPNNFFASFNRSLRKKTEPFKLWLAKIGSERLDEMQDPEIK